MNWFNSLIISICAASLCFGALYAVCPDGKMSKSVRYVFSLCFLLVLVTAAGISIKKSDFSFESYAADIPDTQSIDTAAARYVYSKALESAGIEFSQIIVFTDNSDDGSISISKVLIYSDCDKTRILDALGEAAENFEVEIKNE